MKLVVAALPLLLTAMISLPSSALAQQEFLQGAYIGRAIPNPVDEAAAAKRGEALKLALEGRKLFRAGDVEGAAAAYRKALTSDSTGFYGVAIIGLADCYAAKGNYREAIEGYRIVIHPGPEIKWVSSLANEPDVLLKYALLLSKTGQREEAILMYQQGVSHIGESSAPLLGIRFSSLAFNPRLFEAAALVGIGIRHRQHGEYDEAMARHQEAVRIKPDFAPAYLEMGEVLWHGKGHKKEARAMYQKAVAYDRGEIGAKAKEMLSR